MIARAALHAVLLSAVLVVAFLAVASRSEPSTQADVEERPPALRIQSAEPERLRVGLDVVAGGWVVLPEWFGVWVAGPGTLLEIDEETGSVRQTGSGTWDYDHVRLARYGEGSILVASGTNLWTIDASSGGVVERRDLSDVGVVDGVLRTTTATWITATGPGGGVLLRVDPGSDPPQLIQIGRGRHELVRSAGFLVVASQDATAPGVVRIDPRTGRSSTLHQASGSIAAVGSRVWITSVDGIVCRDVIDGSSCGRVEIPRAVAIAADGARLWVLSATGSKSETSYEPDPTTPATLTLVDGVSGEVVAGRLTLPAATPASISAFGGHVWIGFHDEGRVLRIDCGDSRCFVPGWDQST